MQKPDSEISRLSKSQRRLFKLLLILGGVLLGLLIAEVSLRIIGYSYPIFYTVDQERGVALRPGMAGWYRREGESFVRINSDGLRDREHAKEKPANTLRIAVVGDSYAEALQVSMEGAFWMVMERRLQGCPKFADKNVEVINFGVSGYGTAQELITLRRHVWDYHPNIVLLAVTTNNDVTDNSRALKKTDEIPYFVYRGDQLTLDNSFRETAAFRLRSSALNRLGMWFRDRSRVIQAIHQAQVAIKSYLASRRTSPAPTAQASIVRNFAAQPPTPNEAAKYAEVGIDNLIYRAPESAVWDDAWRVTEALMKLMRDEVKGKGAKFLVVTLSNGIQVHPVASARAAFMKSLDVDDLFYPDWRIKALGEREGFAVFSLAPLLQAYAEQNQVYLHGFGSNIGNGHWNQLGHRVAGEMIAQKLCEGIAD